ncbi:MAG: hypothetical protein R2697_07615 [Ilumatobacteraceae bacterium]
MIIRKIDGAEILRRVEQHGVTSCARTGGAQHDPRCRQADWDGPIPVYQSVSSVLALPAADEDDRAV